MDYIKYETTLKASGREYSKIVFWNRFIRNPIELILTWLPAAITIVCIGTRLLFFLSCRHLCSMLVLSHLYFWFPV